MRGDSRIDLFAKSLALMGLGVIAGIGAAIDYWPGDVRLPAVARHIGRPLTPAVRTAIELSTVTLSGPALVLIRETRSQPVTRLAPVARLEPAVVSAVATVEPPATELAVTVSTEVELPAFEPAFDVRAGLLAESLPVAAFADTEEPAVEAIVADALRQPLPPMLLLDQSADGFFSGMLRKTGSSVGSSLASVSSSLDKAGTSLAGAVRVVSDLVKKAF